jgi:hypothetical protein
MPLHWLPLLESTRLQVLAFDAQHETAMIALNQLANDEAEFALALTPVPRDPAAHVREAHQTVRPLLASMHTLDPSAHVHKTESLIFTPRKVLRRVLDHALDHLNQLEQWLIWQRGGDRPAPTDGWIGSAETLPEDTLPLTERDLAGWLWRIDLAVEVLATRASQLSAEQLDWSPPNEWSLRKILHHTASGEVYYVDSLLRPLPAAPRERYLAANTHLRAQLTAALTTPADADHTYFCDDHGFFSAEQAAEAILGLEQTFLNNLG